MAPNVSVPAVVADDSAAASNAYATVGCVVVRGLLDREAVGAVACRLAEMLRASGRLSNVRGTPSALQLVAASAASDVASDRALYRQLLSSEALYELVRTPALIALVSHLLKEVPLLVHPNVALRVVPPSRDGAMATPAHQDHANMQGSPTAIVAWLPLVPCTSAMAPIEVATGSHRLGLRTPGPVRSRVRTCRVDDLDGRWAMTEVEPGDAVLFSSLSVHRAGVNTSRWTRLSVDARYQPRSEPVCQASLMPSAAPSWAALTEGWRHPDLLPGYAPNELQIVAYDSGFGGASDP